MDKVNTFKDYILMLAKEGKGINESYISLEDKHVWIHYINELESGGYLRVIPIYGMPWFTITPKGTVHLLNGGFSGDKQKTSIDTKKYFDMFIEVLMKEGLSLLVGKLFK